MKQQKEKGITLVALVITIIVLVILVGVSVSTALNTGLIGNSKNAVAQYDKAQTQEEIEIDKVAKTLDATTAAEITAGKYAGDSNKKYVSGGKTAYIPAGFTVSNVKTYNEDNSINEDETDIGKGLVIYSNKANGVATTAEDYMAEIKKGTSGYTLEGLRRTYNQYVWIPVENPSDIYGTITEADVTLNPNDGLVVGEKYGKLYNFGHPNDYNGYATSPNDSRITAHNWPSHSTYNLGVQHEPAYKADSTYADGSEYNKDANGNKIITEAGIKNEFSKMIASVEAYGGFYIGRYELTGTVANPSLVKGVNPLTSDASYSVTSYLRWYGLYTMCEKLEQNNDKVKAHTTMIWGCQWDQAVKKSLSDKADFLTNTGDYGVYGVSSKAKSGTKAAAYNIYDMEGNVWDWTLESIGSSGRVRRSGGFGESHGPNIYPAHYRYHIDPAYARNFLGCRPQLYL